MSSSPDWADLWRRAADADSDSDRRLIGDVCAGTELITDHGAADPDEVIALAIAGAQAAEAAALGLGAEWALYTPQQAAVVVSALLAQINAAGAALERLSEYLHVMEARGDIDTLYAEGIDGLAAGSAVALLTYAGREARTAVSHAEETVHALAETPYLGTLPTDPHETITAVADLLGDAATLTTDHHIQDPAELEQNYRQGFGCGCSITLHDATGMQWTFQRGDSAWTLFRRSDVDDNGVLRRWTDLDASDARAHPGHLATLIRQAMQ